MAQTQKHSSADKSKNWKSLWNSLNPFQKKRKSEMPEKNSTEPAAPARRRAKKSRHVRKASKAKSHKSERPVKKTEGLPDPNAVIPERQKDAAHSPGHRKMNLKENFLVKTGEKTQIQQSAERNLSRGEKMAQISTPQRRINGSGRGA